MANNYEILGLKEGADEKEIKRAYFKLVRQFSPEKDPERFQQIREAYENLSKGKTQAQLTLKIPEDPFAGRMFQQILTRYRQREYEGAIKTAEEAIRYFGECEGFLYYLALSQRKDYYTGKSVKNFEKLVELDPEKMEFARELAISYFDRGYGKKAYTAFGKAYDMGCRDVEFLNCYALNCKERGDFKRGMNLLFEVIEAGKSDRKEYMYEMLDSYGGLFLLCQTTEGERLEECWDSFLGFLDDSAPYLEEHQEELQSVIVSVLTMAGQRSKYEKIGQQIRDRLKRGLGREKADELWREMEHTLEYTRIKGDLRLSMVMKVTYEAFVLRADTKLEDDEDNSPEIRRFVILDSELCILEEWPKIKGEIEIVKDEYPGFYAAIREYIETIEQTNNLNYLREKLRKEYDRKSHYISGGLYGEKYAQNVRQSKVVAESDDMEPYVRMQPKVGRNDPCPCGSGKKYKKCCGKA